MGLPLRGMRLPITSHSLSCDFLLIAAPFVVGGSAGGLRPRRWPPSMPQRNLKIEELNGRADRLDALHFELLDAMKDAEKHVTHTAQADTAATTWIATIRRAIGDEADPWPGTIVATVMALRLEAENLASTKT